MKSFFPTICYLVFLCFYQNLAQASEAPREKVKLIVQGCPNRYTNESYAKEWRRKVKSEIDITPDLLLMIHQEKDWELIGDIFTTLSERDDITQEMVENLMGPLEEIFSKEPTSDMLSSNYACGVIYLIRKSPSSKNEQFLLSILDKNDGYYNWVIISSLAVIGTEKSLSFLKKIYLEIDNRSGRRGSPSALQYAISSIEMRLNSIDRRTKKSDLAQVDLKSNMTSPKVNSIDKSNQKSSIERIVFLKSLLWCGLILACIIFIFKLTQKQVS